jgi:hypothetical protein
LLNAWPLQTSSSSTRLSSILASSNQNFVAITGNASLSFHDASKQKQIGPEIDHAGDLYFMTLSLDGANVVTGEKKWKKSP